MRKHLMRVLSLVLTIALLMSIFAPAVSAASYTDISGRWFTAAAERWAGYNITPVTGDKLRPEEFITKAEFYTMVTRLFGVLNEEDTSSVSDIKPEDWYTPVIGRMMHMGLIPLDAYTVEPTTNITREQAIKVIAEAFRLAGFNEYSLKLFKDYESISPEARDGLAQAVGKGYIKGITLDTLAPKEYLTRAQALTIFDNIAKGFYQTAGTYSANLQGNVLVNSPNVVLSQSSIQGDVYVAHGIGEGTFTLSNTSVSGRVVINGGGMHTINIVGCSIYGEILIDMPNGVPPVRLYTDSSSIGAIKIANGDVTVETSSAGSVTLNNSNNNVTVTGSVGDLVLNGEGNVLTIGESSTIGNIKLNASAIDNNITVSKGATVSSLYNDAGGLVLNNRGSINTASINASAELSGYKPYSVAALAPNLIYENYRPATPTPKPTGTPTPNKPTNPPYLGLVTPDGVKLNKDTIDMKQGETFQLVATVSPADAKDKTVKWSTSSDKIVTVSETGLIRAVGIKGEKAKVTVKTNVGGYTAVCEVRITEGVPSTTPSPSPSPSPSAAPSGVVSITGVEPVIIGGKLSLKGVTNPVSLANTVTKWAWSSSDTSVGTVSGSSSSATFTGTGSGKTTVTLTITEGGKTYSATAEVVVKSAMEAAEVASLSISPNPIKLSPNRMCQISLLVKYKGSTDAEVNEVGEATYKVENESIATVSEDGLVTATVNAKVGDKTKLIATSKRNPEITAEAAIEIIAPPQIVAINLTKFVSFIPSNMKVDAGKEYKDIGYLTAMDQYGNMIKNAKYELYGIPKGEGLIDAIDADGKTVYWEFTDVEDPKESPTPTNIPLKLYGPDYAKAYKDYDDSFEIVVDKDKTIKDFFEGDYKSGFVAHTYNNPESFGGDYPDKQKRDNDPEIFVSGKNKLNAFTKKTANDGKPYSLTVKSGLQINNLFNKDKTERGIVPLNSNYLRLYKNIPAQYLDNNDNMDTGEYYIAVRATDLDTKQSYIGFVEITVRKSIGITGIHIAATKNHTDNDNGVTLDRSKIIPNLTVGYLHSTSELPVKYTLATAEEANKTVDNDSYSGKDKDNELFDLNSNGQVTVRKGKEDSLIAGTYSILVKANNGDEIEYQPIPIGVTSVKYEFTNTPYAFALTTPDVVIGKSVGSVSVKSGTGYIKKKFELEKVTLGGNTDAIDPEPFAVDPSTGAITIIDTESIKTVIKGLITSPKEITYNLTISATSAVEGETDLYNKEIATVKITHNDINRIVARMPDGSAYSSLMGAQVSKIYKSGDRKLLKLIALDASGNQIPNVVFSINKIGGIAIADIPIIPLGISNEFLVIDKIDGLANLIRGAGEKSIELEIKGTDSIGATKVDVVTLVIFKEGLINVTVANTLYAPSNDPANKIPYELYEEIVDGATVKKYLLYIRLNLNTQQLNDLKVITEFGVTKKELTPDSLLVEISGKSIPPLSSIPLYVFVGDEWLSEKYEFNFKDVTPIP